MRAVALLLLTSIIVLCVACSTHVRRPLTGGPVSTQETYLLHVDKLLNAQERAIVIDSFKEWERDTLGVVRFMIAEDGWNSDTDRMSFTGDECTHDVFVISMTSNDKPVQELEKRKGKELRDPVTLLGFTRSICEERFVVLVMDRLYDKALLRNVAVHEAGHLVGLDHIPVPNESVMFPSMDKATPRPTELDLKQFCMLYRCDWRQMVMAGGVSVGQASNSPNIP